MEWVSVSSPLTEARACRSASGIQSVPAGPGDLDADAENEKSEDARQCAGARGRNFLGEEFQADITKPRNQRDREDAGYRGGLFQRHQQIGFTVRWALKVITTAKP